MNREARTLTLTLFAAKNSWLNGRELTLQKSRAKEINFPDSAAKT
jgi:hypothetical protein